MSQQIEFRSGDPHSFVATRTFDMGQTGLKLSRGDRIQFDGLQAIIPGYATMAMPQLRGAIKVGWLVLAETYDQDDMSAMQPKSAGVKVRAAEGGNPMAANESTTITTQSVESEERTVTNVQQHASQTKANNNAGRANRMSTQAESSEGVPVRAIKTPAVQKTNVEHAGQAISEATSLKIDPGQGRSREDLMASMSPEDRAQYESEIQSRRAAYDSPVVGHAKKLGTEEREGMRITGSTGGGVEIADMGGTGQAGPAQLTQFSEEGLTFRNTNGPGTVKRAQEAPQSDAQGNTSRAIAVAICPDFPDNYRFADPVRKKMARLQADYDDRPDVIRAVAAADTDPEMRARLIEEFPQAFSG